MIRAYPGLLLVTGNAATSALSGYGCVVSDVSRLIRG